MDVLQEVLRELAAERLMKEDTTGEKVAQFIEELMGKIKQIGLNNRGA